MKKLNFPPTVKFTDLLAEEEISSFEASLLYGGLPSSSQVCIAEPTHQQPKASESAATNKSPEVVNTNWSLGLQNVLAEPPAEFPRYLLVGGMLFFLAFGTWAWLGRVDEVGQARGRLVPQGEVYKLNPVDSGQAIRLSVREGDIVRAGDKLVELDKTEAASQVMRLQQIVAAYQVELNQKEGISARSQLEARQRIAIALANLQSQQAALAAATEKVTTTRNLLELMQNQLTASQARLQKLEPLTNTSQERLQQLRADVVANKARIDRLKVLADEGAISKEYLFQAEQAVRDRTSAISQSQLQEDALTNERIFQAEQAVRDRVSNISQNQGELKQSLAEAAQIRANLLQKQAELNTINLENQQQYQQMQVEISQLKAKMAEAANSLATAKTKLAQRDIVAPIDGVVSSLNIRNPGEFVQTGQTIVEIAPRSAPLVLAANLPNREAGFVKVGMEVQVKLDAYPYQDFGIVTGKVVAVSPDTKADNQQEAVNRVEVSLERSHVTANQQTIPFKFGQTATADIIIRRRRIADLLLDPIKQIQKGGLNL